MGRQLKEIQAGGGGRFLISAAAFVIVVAGMRASQELLVPFLLSLFIAIIVAPALSYLQAKRVPTLIAILLIMLIILAMGMLLGNLVGSSVDAFSEQLPTYQEKLHLITRRLLHWLSVRGIDLSEQSVTTLLDPSRAMKMAAQGLSSLGGLLTNTFLILLTVVFILIESAGFPAKLRRILPDPENTYGQIERILKDINRYMLIKTLTSLLTGAVIAFWLWLLGVDYPLLWGVIAFLFNYVPTIGSLIAAVPAILLALVQLGSGTALWTLTGYLVVNNLVGTVIEPRFMGKGLGLSVLVVFLSLVFWGWVLGLIGMFLSVPLTMTLKIALGSREQTRWIAVLLGPDVEEAPPNADNEATSE